MADGAALPDPPDLAGWRRRRGALYPAARRLRGAGRYLLDAAKGADLGGPFEDAGGGPGGDAAGGAGWPTDSNEPARRALVLDFNFAYHPSCAFDPRWACPLAPPENRL